MNRTSRIGRRALLRVAAGAPALALLRGAPAHAAAAIERVSSPGGIQAWLIVDRSLPLLSLEFNFRGGAATLPAGKEGLAPMTASILSNARVRGSFGAAGGHDGAPGVNRVERADGRIEPLGHIGSVAMQPGDVFVIETPGGGGWGPPG